MFPLAKLDQDKYDNNKSLRALVFTKLQNDIINGKYRDGENLIETKLSEEFGVSRTPIREAITQLEFEGLVKFIPNKGAIVKGISNRDIDDIYTIRVLIEGLASKWAANNIDSEEKNKLKEILDLEEFYTTKGDTSHILDLDTQFHDLVFKASKSTPLMYMLRTFHHYTQKTRERTLSLKSRAFETLKEHRKIYEAIIVGDENEAERLTYLHISNAVERYKNLNKK